MTDDLFTVTHAELMADVVGIKQTGVPCGLVNQRIEPGFVLENGIVLLESEKDKDGQYIGGAGMDGMYLRTNERYVPLPGPDGKICAFSRVDKNSVLEQLKIKSARGKSDPKSNKISSDKEL